MMEMFSYPFMQKALIAGICIAIAAALVGVPLVLRKHSMIGDGVSHAAVGAFAIATVLGIAPLAFAIPAVIIASFLVLRLANNKKSNGDAGIAILSASSLAIGTLAISISKGVNIDLNSYLFGSILAVNWLEVWLSLGVSIISVVLFVLAYHRIFALTFEEEFAAAIGVKTKIYDAILAAICSIIIVLGIRLVGALLISSLIIFPTLTAMCLAKSFKKIVVTSAIISAIAFVTGLIISYFAATPTGATIVIVNLITLIVAKVYQRLS